MGALLENPKERERGDIFSVRCATWSATRRGMKFKFGINPTAERNAIQEHFHGFVL